MAAKRLALPPSDFDSINVAAASCDPTKLFRVSSHSTGEPFFGSSGVNRFDSPAPPAFSTCYLAYTLPVAIAESVLHDEVPERGIFKLAKTTLESKFVIRFTGSTLTLANLSGASLKRLGGSADLAGASVDYAITKSWSLAVHGHPANFDGIVYMSRHINTQKAVVLFNRAGPKIQSSTVAKLIEYPEFSKVAKLLGIRGI
ncbi:MAG: RES family NAD+ phosphorylase [Burkholderiales bacterium]